MKKRMIILIAILVLSLCGCNDKSESGKDKKEKLVSTKPIESAEPEVMPTYMNEDNTSYDEIIWAMEEFSPQYSEKIVQQANERLHELGFQYNIRLKGLKPSKKAFYIEYYDQYQQWLRDCKDKKEPLDIIFTGGPTEAFDKGSYVTAINDELLLDLTEYMN